MVALTTDAPDLGARIIHAENRVVCPGFLDIHMHEAPVADLSDIEGSILGNMLRMGVTTALGGNCGENVLPPKEYFQRVEGRLPIYLALLAGHGAAREAAGYTDRYQSLAPEQVHRVTDILNAWLEDGCFGISYGIRYYPGTTREELLETAQLCQKEHLLVAAMCGTTRLYLRLHYGISGAGLEIRAENAGEPFGLHGRLRSDGPGALHAGRRPGRWP